MADVAVDVSEPKVTKASTPKKEMKLCDLKVADLKAELEKRGLDKTGVKAALAERLGKAIEDEGNNPEEFVFELTTDSPLKKSKRDARDLNNDTKHETDNEEEEMEEDKTENRSDEVLQLSLDKEDNIDAKDGTEYEQSDVNGQDGKLESTESFAKENDTEPMETESAEADADTEKSASQTSASNSSTPLKAKPTTNKNTVKVISKATKGTQGAKSIWITNLPVSTRAADLKSFFAKHGKVNLVKIVTNARQTSGEKKFYGYITMTTTKEASKAVQDLNNTELNGQAVKLELTNDQPNTLLKKTTKVFIKKKLIGMSGRAPTTTTTAATTTTKAKEKTSESKDTKTESTEETQEKETKDDKSSRKERERDHRSRERRDSYRDFRRPAFRRPFGFRGRGRGRGGFSFRDRPLPESFRRPFGRKPFFSRGSYRPAIKSNFMSFKIREDRQRERFRERSIRESERRRAEENFRQKLVERKQRDEAYRLEREKVQLRIERELLEREKAEYLKNEREKQRMERERIEREREKLRRQAQMRDLSSKRPFTQSPVERDPLWEKEKRARHYESRYASYSEKPVSDSRQDFRESSYRAKFEHRPDHYERDPHSASTSRSEFSKYSKDKSDINIRDHDERRVYKRPYFKEESSRGYPQRETERYASSMEDRGYKRKIHENLRSLRPRGGGGGGGRRMPYY